MGADTKTKATGVEIKRFFHLLKPERKEIRLIFLFAVVTGSMSLALPLAVNSFVNTLGFGIQTLPFVQMLLVILMVLLVALTISATLKVAQYYVMEIIQRRLYVRLCADLAARLPKIKPSAYGHHSGPELVNRFFEILFIQKSSAALFLEGLNLLLNTVVGAFILSFYHPFLLVFVVGMTFALLAIVFLGGRRGTTTAIGESDAKYNTVAWIEQLAAMPRMLKYQPAKCYAIERTDQVAGNYLAARKQHFKILIRQISFLVSIEVIGAVALLGIGGNLVLSQQLTLGQLVAAELILATILASIAKLGKQFEAWYDTVAGMNKLGYLIDLEPQRQDGDAEWFDQDDNILIATENLKISFDNGVSPFSPLTFTVKKGQKFGVFAKAGSGLTSLLEVIIGIGAPHTGIIKINGRRLESWNLDALQSEIMLVRPRQIFEGTILENLTFNRTDISKQDIDRVLKVLGLTRFLECKEKGLNTLLLQDGRNISTGESARLVLARAILQRPRIVLIDDVLEVFAADERLRIAKFLAEQPWTMLLGSQDPDILNICDDIVELHTPA